MEAILTGPCKRFFYVRVFGPRRGASSVATARLGTGAGHDGITAGPGQDRHTEE